MVVVTRFLSLSTIFFVFIFGGFLWSAPASKLEDDHWLGVDEESEERVEHVEWDNFLASYVEAGKDGINRVGYSSVTEKDRGILYGYIERLSGVRVTGLNRSEQMAYWINLYNALTVKEILEAYPVKSIKDISGGFFNFGPWDKKVVKVEGRELSLNGIEHNILRPIWQDNRIHYAVNCASLSCPNLALRSYESFRLEEMLDFAARSYVNHERGVREDEGGGLVVSSIYTWYRDDFGGSKQGVLLHLRKYADEDLEGKLGPDAVIVGDEYDWGLNEWR
jgi:hypothetical protein